MSTADCAIEARHLVKTYAVHGKGKKHGIRALDGLDISVPRGMIYGLLGPNGAGKSTTVKILTSLARPDSGTARVEGIDVLARPGQLRRVIGVVAQRSGADPTATGRENLILQGRLYGLRGGTVKARADELLGHFGLTEAAGRLVRTYSGGMQRRLDVALGLMHRPAVLFLDEPTTGLDPESRAAMWQEITRLAGGEGMTVLLTTHYLEEADRLASRLAIVDRGRVVTSGTPDELKGELRGDAVQVELPAPWDDADASLVRRVLQGLPAVRDVVIAGRDRGRVGGDLPLVPEERLSRRPETAGATGARRFRLSACGSARHGFQPGGQLLVHRRHRGFTAPDGADVARDDSQRGRHDDHRGRRVLRAGDPDHGAQRAGDQRPRGHRHNRAEDVVGRHPGQLVRRDVPRHRHRPLDHHHLDEHAQAERRDADGRQR